MKRISLVFLAASLTILTLSLASCASHRNLARIPGISVDAADPSGFVTLTDVVPDVILEIRYYSSFNFVGTRVDGYEEPVALITKEAAAALKKVSDEAIARGYRLKIWDAYRSGHSRGSVVDLTLVDMRTGRDLDMGYGFDWFGGESHPDYREGITEEQYQNRMILRELMLKHGFLPITEEWWHFILKDEPYPDTYFTLPVRAL